MSGHSHKHQGAQSIDYYAYTSGMRKVNASFKVLFSVTLLILCIVLDHIWVSVTVMAGMGLLTVCAGGLSLRRYLSLMKIPAAFILMGSIAIAAGIAARPYGDFNLNLHFFYLYTSGADLLRAARLGLKALGAVSAMYMLTLSTPASEIISVLGRAHLPKLLVELMNMIYRFIFILMDVQSRMSTAARARLGYEGFKRSCYTFGHIAGNLLILSFRKAGIYYDALESRGYDGELEFLEEEKKIKAWQVFAAAGYLLALTALAVIL
ncbi:cobalt ECF transporter T component CbiQ [Lachnospiraceae bacterium ASD3451]|uniref:cobalt ECF transporter T component CbiQ n=1 Tax=Diplocloster agilis TaxID=2850323 RepID=UPI001D8CCEE3|nr:cobalt ECF transporter T component CbiQ [Diplocloster agilis]MBU9744353.1 cobalt ECF transporter T component CbiQ [Diplocloster agilis]